MVQIEPGQPGYGQGVGRYEQVPTGEKGHGAKTMMLGSVLCCCTGGVCCCGFCVPLDEKMKQVWIPGPAGIAPAPMTMGSSAPSSAPPIAVPATCVGAPATVKVYCGGTCGKMLDIQPMGTGIVEFRCPHCAATNRLEWHGTPATQEPFKYPPWWLTKPSMGSSEFIPVGNDVIQAVQEMLDRTWKGVTTRDRSYEKPKKMQVIQVNQNCNPKLWHNYLNAKKGIRAKMADGQIFSAKTSDGLSPALGTIDSDVNEFLLFHGTKPDAVENICKSDFMVNMSGSHAGSLYGRGIYFGENSSKSDEYAHEGAGIFKGVYAMLLCRVACGRILYNDEVNPNAGSLEHACRDAGQFDSVLGDREKCRQTYREFIVFNNDMAYPEYAILYRRID